MSFLIDNRPRRKSALIGWLLLLGCLIILLLPLSLDRAHDPQVTAFIPSDAVQDDTLIINDETLIAYYTFDEIIDDIIQDMSGHGHDATMHGKAVLDQGKIGQALSLNGSSSYVQLPAGIVSDLEEITITAWVKVNFNSTWSRVFDFGSGTSNWMFLTLHDHTGLTRFATLKQGGQEYVMNGPAYALTSQSLEWHHLALTIKERTYSLYIDGQQAASASNMQNLPTHLGHTAHNYIGKSQFAADPYFNGRIDDFRIYSRALSDNEIVALVTEPMDEEQLITYTANWLQVKEVEPNVLSLPSDGPGGVQIAWESSHPHIISDSGLVTPPAPGEGDQTVIVKAVISKGQVQTEKSFSLNIWETGSVAYRLKIDSKHALHDISPTLYGVFYEDINYAGDGGLYGELIQNRSFEFSSPLYGWRQVREGGGMGTITTAADSPLHHNNPRYVTIDVESPGEGVGLANSGYGGIALQHNERYDFTVYARTDDVLQHPIQVQLREKQGEQVFGTCEIEGLSHHWQQIGCSIISNADTTDAQLVITLLDQAQVHMDMISLFPNDTYKQRDNGLRKDLAEMLEAMNPSFFRFPGGCIVEGGSLDNRYRWKNTIGDVSERQVQRNQWAGKYYQSFGLGFYEYFQFAEDLGAEPLPVIFAGVISCDGNPPMIPLSDLEPYIQDALDLIEYANGDAETTYWGALRAAHGHPEPFNLKFLGIGNELWGQHYFARYERFYDTIKAMYPEIQIVLSAGAFPDDVSFHQTYEWLASHGYKADLVDEHMYQSPQWLYDQVTRYDSYSREGPKVFVGEYAAHGVGKRNNMESALAEAAFMTGLERNADIVAMAAYAPLFARQHYTQWTPDLIWFNSHEVYGTPNYYVQKLFATYIGDEVLPSQLIRKNERNETYEGPLYSVTTKDRETNELIVKVVNASPNSQLTELTIEGAEAISDEAAVFTIQADSLEAENTFEQPELINIQEGKIAGVSPIFNYEFPPYSVTVLRLHMINDR